MPFEGSGKRTHDALLNSEVHVIAGAPHGVNVSHPRKWNDTLITFLSK